MNTEFKLIVGENDGTISNADIKVRWCVPPNLMSSLQDKSSKSVFVLLSCITADGVEMSRKLVPISDLSTYVRFTRAGHGHVINAWILEGEYRMLFEAHATKEGRKSYFSDLYTYTDDLVRNKPRSIRCLISVIKQHSGHR